MAHQTGPATDSGNEPYPDDVEHFQWGEALDDSVADESHNFQSPLAAPPVFNSIQPDAHALHNVLSGPPRRCPTRAQWSDVGLAQGRRDHCR